MIQACRASLKYSDHGKDCFACHEIDLDVRPGEFLGILGPSGSGKSSLLYLLSGLKTPSSGDVLVDGKSMNRMSDKERSLLRLESFGFVFQYPYLLGYLSALENVLIGKRCNSSQDEAIRLLGDLGLAEKTNRKPHELSGGERQRVCVARALMGQPQAIFADEPTASLDHRNGYQVVEMLRTHRAEGALVMVTHDPSMLEAADRIVHLADGELTEWDRS